MHCPLVPPDEIQHVEGHPSDLANELQVLLRSEQHRPGVRGPDRSLRRPARGRPRRQFPREPIRDQPPGIAIHCSFEDRKVGNDFWVRPRLRFPPQVLLKVEMLNVESEEGVGKLPADGGADFHDRHRGRGPRDLQEIRSRGQRRLQKACARQYRDHAEQTRNPPGKAARRRGGEATTGHRPRSGTAGGADRKALPRRRIVVGRMFLAGAGKL